MQRVNEAADYLRDLGIGGSAVGTGRDGREGIPGADEQVSRSRSPGSIFASVRTASSSCRAWATSRRSARSSACLAIDLSKIASDLRLMVMGPRTGIDEIMLPAVQPGSSIMPGKINPSIPEMVNQVCFQVMGCDTTVAIAAEHGQLELNVMMPVIALNVLLSMRILTNAANVVRRAGASRASRRIARCASTGSSARRRWRRRWRRRSATRKAAEISKQSVKEGVLIRDLVKRDKILPDDEIDDVLDLKKMTEIGVPGGNSARRRADERISQTHARRS